MWHTNYISFSKALFLAVLLITITASKLFAQQYAIIPNDSIIANAPFNKVTHFNISQTNLSTEKLVFSWQQIYQSVPLGWIANLCDYGHCYNDLALNGTMDTIFKGDYGLMSVGIDPGTISGTAIVRYIIWENATSSIIDTLTWIISAKNNTGMSEISTINNYLIYPNPTKAAITIFSTIKEAKFIIADYSGKEITNGILMQGANTIPSDGIPTGIYQVIISQNNYETIIKKIIIQR